MSGNVDRSCRTVVSIHGHSIRDCLTYLSLNRIPSFHLFSRSCFQSPMLFSDVINLFLDPKCVKKCVIAQKITNMGPYFEFSVKDGIFTQFEQIPEAISRTGELVSESLSDLTDYRRADASLTSPAIFLLPTPCLHFPDRKKANISSEYRIRESSSLTSHGLPEKT